MTTSRAIVQPAIDLPPGVTGFGIAEVAYLLSRHSGSAALKSRGLMVLDELAVQDDFVRAGASSLVARGLLTEGSSGETALLEWAAFLDYALAAGTTWTEIGINRGGIPDIALVIESPAVIAVLQPRILGTWFASFVDDVTTYAETVLALLREVRAQREDVSFFVVVSDLPGNMDEFSLRPGLTEVSWELDDERVGTAELTNRLRRSQ